jgi:crotonobetainyl-CoA:carnitine CoA-transferase CaiB-like acyl-CoA transferase
MSARPGPLGHVSVVDLTSGPAQAVGSLMVDLGAQVHLVVHDCGPDSGGPRLGDVDLERELRNEGKTRVTIDDSGLVATLLTAADVVLVDEAHPPGHGPSDLRDAYPTAVITSVTPFGLTGPWRSRPATPGVLAATTGLMARSGTAGREPLVPPAAIVWPSIAVHAVWVTLVGLARRRDLGIGSLIDVSAQEALLQTIDPGFGIGGTAAAGEPAWAAPRGRPDADHLYPLLPCTDGTVRLCILSPRQWDGVLDWLGRPEELLDRRFQVTRHRNEHRDQILPRLRARASTLTCREVVAASLDHGFAAAEVLEPARTLEVEHFRSTGTLSRRRLGRAGTTVTVPSVPFTFRESTATGAIDLGAATRAPCAGEPTLDRPLAGLRVLDLGVIVVGADAARVFGDLGADVVKIENPAFPDGSRQSRPPGEVSVSFAYGHRNKRSLGLDLRSEEGRALLLDLAARSDVVLANFKPGTLDRLGLAVETLLEVAPHLVVVESSAYGDRGPWAGRLGYGPLVRASTGLTALWSYPGGHPSGDGSTIYPDNVAGRMSAVLALSLHLGRPHGATRHATVSQADLVLRHLAPEIVAGSLAAQPEFRPRATEDHVLPCRGDDDWLCVSVLPSHLAQIRETVAALPLQAAVEDLLGRGITAGPMLRVADLPTTQHLQERQVFRTSHQPGCDVPTFVGEAAPAAFAPPVHPPERPAPVLGQHTRSVLADVLGLPDATIDRLVATSVAHEAGAPAPVDLA